MASTTVEFVCPSGLTLTASLYAYGSDTIVNGAGDSATERTNAKGLYEFTVTEALDGWYQAIVKNGSGTVVAVYDVWLQDDTGRYRCEDRPQKLQSRIESMAELTGVPSATPDLWDVIMLTYMRERNSHETNGNTGEYKIKDDSGTVVAKKTIAEAGAVYTEGKMTDGP